MYPSALQEFLCDDEYKYSTHDKRIVTLFKLVKKIGLVFFFIAQLLYE